MSGDIRRISLTAVILLVVLRISIGWHLMYEGLWKLSTQKTASPWTAEGYLKNSTGPLRSTFRAMTGDPNDLKWLDYDHMKEKWESWRARFTSHYGLDEDQVAQLDRLMDGTSSFSVPLESLPPGIDLAATPGVHGKAIKYDAKSKRLVVDGELHLTPSERQKLIDVANDLKPVAKDGPTPGSKEELSPEEKSAEVLLDKFIKAVRDVYAQSAKLSFHEKLTALLKGDPERVGVILQNKGAGKGDESEDASGTVVQVGKIEYYKSLIKRFEADYAKARTKSDWEHIDKKWTDLQKERRELVGPVQALDSEIIPAAEELLSTDQLALGPVPEPMTPIKQINFRTMWGLTIFGLLLMIGLFTRLSALGGAALLSLFYLAMPPWPGGQEIPSIEHNLFVNKVSIEMVALLAIAAMPSGRWFGLDAALGVLFARKPKGEPKKR